MKETTIDEYKEYRRKAQDYNKRLLDEIDIQKRTIQLLLVAGFLDKDKLDQATELAGGNK